MGVRAPFTITTSVAIAVFLAGRDDGGHSNRGGPPHQHEGPLLTQRARTPAGVLHGAPVVLSIEADHFAHLVEAGSESIPDLRTQVGLVAHPLVGDRRAGGL